jgi:hypothetical protein
VQLSLVNNSFSLMKVIFLELFALSLLIFCNLIHIVYLFHQLNQSNENYCCNYQLANYYHLMIHLSWICHKYNRSRTFHIIFAYNFIVESLLAQVSCSDIHPTPLLLKNPLLLHTFLLSKTTLKNSLILIM